VSHGGPAAEMRQCHLNNIHFYYYYYYYYHQGGCVCTLFVSKHDCTKTTQPSLPKFCGNVAHGPPNNPLDFGSYSDHVMLRLGLELRLTFHVAAGRQDCVMAR